MITSEYIGHERGQNKAHRLAIGKCNKELNPTSKQPLSSPRERSEYMKQYDYMIILCDHMNMPERLTIRKSDRELKSQVYTAKTLP